MLSLAFLLFSCICFLPNSKGMQQPETSANVAVTYLSIYPAAKGLTLLQQTSKGSLAQPVAHWELPPELREVSGIALVQDNVMACIQDEEGIIFLYDLEKKNITQKIPFAQPGDYEEIVIVGQTAYVLRSDGVILEVSDFRNGNPKTKSYTSVLAPTQDTEGLAYDKKANRLLIACKGYDEKLGHYKGVYAFSLSGKKMQASPLLKISLEQPELAHNPKKHKNLYDVLQPSSLEVHPITGELYLLDAKNYYLITLDNDGSIKKKVVLDKAQLRQAEGLTFNSKGEMFISSEGSKKGKAVILKYSSGI